MQQEQGSPMPKIEETVLPGVGVRHEFVTNNGDRLGVITYRSGRRELLVYDRRDPDSCSEVIRLDTDDTRALTTLLGGSEVAERATAEAYRADGFTIDWTPVAIASACAGQTLRDAVQPAAGSGAFVVAIVRGGQTIPAPPPDFRLAVGDTAVVIGPPDGVRALVAALQRG